MLSKREIELIGFALNLAHGEANSEGNEKLSLEYATLRPKVGEILKEYMRSTARACWNCGGSGDNGINGRSSRCGTCEGTGKLTNDPDFDKAGNRLPSKPSK